MFCVTLAPTKEWFEIEMQTLFCGSMLPCGESVWLRVLSLASDPPRLISQQGHVEAEAGPSLTALSLH